MEKSNESMVFYESWYRALKKKTPEVFKEITTAILEYGLYGQMPEGLSDEAEDVFILAEPNLTANLERRENGRKGGRPPKNHRLSDGKTIGYENAKPNVNGNGNENVNVYIHIRDMYNETCVSYPKVTTLSEKRKKALSARLKVYSVDDFKRLFTKAEESDFLKGSNKSNWSATFDWLICDANMAKVLDGNYDNKKIVTAKKIDTGFTQRDYDMDALEKRLLAN